MLLAGHLLDTDTAYRLGRVMEITAPEVLIRRAHAVLDRICGPSALALRITKLVADSSGAHPLTDDLAQAILFETEDIDQRMAEFLERGNDDPASAGVDRGDRRRPHGRWHRARVRRGGVPGHRGGSGP